MDPQRLFVFNLSHRLVLVCEIEFSHMGKYSVNPDLVCKKILSHTEKDKKPTAACRLHTDLWRHCNVIMTSPCRISANLGFSGSLFHVFPNMKCGT